MLQADQEARAEAEGGRRNKFLSIPLSSFSQ
jgi:hypothetical protein